MPQLRRVFAPVFLLTLALAVRPGAQAPAPAASPGLPAGFDAWVGRVMQAFAVPGLSVAIVKDDRVVLARGYGVRRLGSPALVDAQTLFGIASNSKAFTATAIGMLVEEGKVAWEAPVTRYLPGFQMWDPWVTRELTVRDLLVHRSGLGLGAGDLLWWPPTTFDRTEIASRIRAIRPVTSFRSAYAYDNVLYLVAGNLIEAVSGQRWEDFVRTRILERVGMTGTSPRCSTITGGGNVATPHARVDGIVRPVAPFAADNTDPAAGINSNAEDMAKWLRVQLARGRLPDGSRLFSEDTARQLTMMVTPIPTREPAPELAAQRSNFRGYALGFNVVDYRGRKVVMHSGSLPGFVSRVFMVPGVGLGVAVLTNQESGEAFDSIAYRVADHYLGAPPTDWVEAYAKVSARQEATTAEEVRKAAAARDASSRPSLALERYAGTYADAWYGEVGIALEGGTLVMRFTRTPSLVGNLEHFQYDTFIVRWRDRELRADAYVTFGLNPDGSIDQVKMKAVSPATDFSFDFHDLLLRPAR